MSAAPHQLDLTAPPVVKTIAQRSLIVGVVFAVSPPLSLVTPNGREEFFRAYLLGFMCWLGVALGSMAILMIRHLTGGGWGMVIRRILGAAMRTVPLLAILFIPIIVRHAHLYIWAHAAGSCRKTSTCASTCKTSPKPISRPTASLSAPLFYFAIWNLALVPALALVETNRPRRRSRQHGAFQSRRRARPDPLRIHHFFRRHRLGHVARSQLDFHHLRSGHPDRRSAGRHVFRRRRRAHPLQLQANVGDVEARLRPRPRQVDDRPSSWSGPTSTSRSGSSSGPAICPPKSPIYIRRLNGGWGAIGLFLVLFHFAVPFAMLLVAPLQAQHPQAGLARRVDDADALRRFVLDDRAEFFQDFQRHDRGHRRAHRHWRILAVRTSSAISLRFRSFRPMIRLPEKCSKCILTTSSEFRTTHDATSPIP